MDNPRRSLIAGRFFLVAALLPAWGPYTTFFSRPAVAQTAESDALQLPTNWEDLTLADYEELHEGLSGRAGNAEQFETIAARFADTYFDPQRLAVRIEDFDRWARLVVQFSNGLPQERRPAGLRVLLETFWSSDPLVSAASEATLRQALFVGSVLGARREQARFMVVRWLTLRGSTRSVPTTTLGVVVRVLADLDHFPQERSGDPEGSGPVIATPKSPDFEAVKRQLVSIASERLAKLTEVSGNARETIARCALALAIEPICDPPSRLLMEEAVKNLVTANDRPAEKLLDGPAHVPLRSVVRRYGGPELEKQMLTDWVRTSGRLTERPAPQLAWAYLAVDTADAAALRQRLLDQGGRDVDRLAAMLAEIATVAPKSVNQEMIDRLTEQYTELDIAHGSQPTQVLANMAVALQSVYGPRESQKRLFDMMASYWERGGRFEQGFEVFATIGQVLAGPQEEPSASEPQTIDLPWQSVALAGIQRVFLSNDKALVGADASLFRDALTASQDWGEDDSRLASNLSRWARTTGMAMSSSPRDLAFVLDLWSRLAPSQGTQLQASPSRLLDAVVHQLANFAEIDDPQQIFDRCALGRKAMVTIADANERRAVFMPVIRPLAEPRSAAKLLSGPASAAVRGLVRAAGDAELEKAMVAHYVMIHPKLQDLHPRQLAEFYEELDPQWGDAQRRILDHLPPMLPDLVEFASELPPSLLAPSILDRLEQRLGSLPSDVRKVPAAAMKDVARLLIASHGPARTRGMVHEALAESLKAAVPLQDGLKATFAAMGRAFVTADSTDAELTEVQRQEALSALMLVVLDNDEVLARIDARLLYEAVEVAVSWGATDAEVARSTASWASRNDSWDDAATADQLFIARILNFAAQMEEHPNIAEARVRLRSAAQYRLSQLVNQFDDSRQVIAACQLAHLASEASTAAERQVLAQELKRALSPSKVVATLDGPASAAVRGLARVLGGDALEQEFLITWVRSTRVLESRPPRELAEIYNRLDAQQVQVRNRLIEAVTDDTPRFIALADELVNVTPQNLTPPLADRLWQAIAQTGQRSQKVTIDSLLVGAQTMAAAYGPVRGKTLFTDRAVELIASGCRVEGDFQEYQQLAGALWEEDIDRRLRDRMEGPDGSARLDLAQALAWIYSARNEVPRWRQWLESQAERPNLAPDVRASWYMARAHAAHVVPADLSPLVGLPWVEKAFGAADSETLRLSCLEWIVAGHLAIRDFQTIQSLLESVAHQFVLENSRQRIEDLRATVAQALEAEAVRQAQIARAVQARRLRGQLASLQERLAEMEKAGESPENLASVQRSMEALQKQLTALDAR